MPHAALGHHRKVVLGLLQTSMQRIVVVIGLSSAVVVRGTSLIADVAQYRIIQPWFSQAISLARILHMDFLKYMRRVP